MLLCCDGSSPLLSHLDAYMRLSSKQPQQSTEVYGHRRGAEWDRDTQAVRSCPCSVIPPKLILSSASHSGMGAGDVGQVRDLLQEDCVEVDAFSGSSKQGRDPIQKMMEGVNQACSFTTFSWAQTLKM